MALLVGCAEPITTVPAEAVGDQRLVASVLGSCAQGLFTQFNAQQWACGSQVNFYTAEQSLVGPLNAAVAEWRTMLQSTGFTELPDFDTTEEPTFAQATATGNGNAPGPFCGLWSAAVMNLFVHSGAECGSEDSAGPLHNLLLHELGHPIGWSGSATHKVFRTPAAGHCVMHLPVGFTINGAVCVHEVEGVLAGYGLASYDGDTFFDTPFVIGSASTLPSLILPVGQNATLSPGALELELGGVVPGTENAYSWHSSASAIASVTSAGVVTALSPGTAIIQATPLAGAGYLLAHPFRNIGRTATITVPAPPPPTPDILLDEIPVHTAGWHTLTFVGPGTPGALAWSIDDSRTTIINPDTTFTTPGWTANIYIEAGSYTLRVTTAGIIRDFPVCTGSGGGGGGSTDAVANCPPPEQEDE